MKLYKYWNHYEKPQNETIWIERTKNSLTIRGSDRNETTIYGNWSMNPVVGLTAKNIYFGGFNITQRLDMPDTFGGVASRSYVRRLH
ncbi:MAG: hypothetical protein J5U19_08990 [Candidatus Methanoperedens sp.]|nr:hypothetical protein [Candidatus Methanoperedens sp.]